MRNKFLLLVFIGTANFLFAQKIVVEWGKTRAIRPDFIGTNGNVIGKTNPWDSSEMLNALQKMGVSNIRYPAGTLANYWDWDLGWLDPTVPDSLMINWVAQQGINRSSQRYPLENFAKAIKSTQVEPIYVLNMLTKDLEHSLRGLRKAKALGLPIHLIEMGNELYFNLPLESKVYPSPEDYGKACQLWISAIKKEFPEARCAVLGTELNRNARQKDWTERVLQNAPNADAVIFHVYTGFGLDGGRERNTNNAGQEGLTNATRKFGTPLERQQYELAQLQMPEGYARFLNLAQEVASRYRKMTVPTHMDVWVTEFNVRADSSAIRGTWANLLFIAKFYEEFLEGGQVNLSCFHNIQGPLFAAYFFDTQGLNHVLTEKITTRVGSLSAGGQITQWFADLMKGNTKATAWQFDKQDNHPHLFGYSFGKKSGKSQSIVINYSDKVQKIDVNHLNIKGKYTQYSAKLTHYVQNTEGVDQSKGLLTDTLEMKPFSITIINQ